MCVQTALLSPLSATRGGVGFENTHPGSPRWGEGGCGFCECVLCVQPGPAPEPQPASASPSQPGAGPASRQPGRAAATSQGPARHKKETRSGRVTESHGLVAPFMVTWASSSSCLTLFFPPPRPFERARTLTVYGRSDNRANSEEPRNRTKIKDVFKRFQN